ncbi:hypothetical protein C0995_009848 [Termitomyces sp. Mi166|nr:hypothetical protein C0995_009848 [Termitomyces sp. Mi166\
MSDGVKLNGGILRQKWSCFADLKGIPKDKRLTLNERWLTALKKRCGLCNYKTHGEAGSASIEEVETEQEQLMPPDCGLMDKQTSGVKGNKKQLTYQMALYELLNPVNKNSMHNASSSEMEIFQAVMECVESEQTRKISGGDLEDLNALSTDAELKPAHHEALKAALTLQAYVADLNEPFARELEDILAKFGYQTCLDEFKSLCPTAITDYLPWLASNA